MSKPNTFPQLLQLKEDNLSKQKLLHMISIKTAMSCGFTLRMESTAWLLLLEVKCMPQ